MRVLGIVCSRPNTCRCRPSTGIKPNTDITCIHVHVLQDFKGEVQSRITIISKERVKISLQIGAKMMKIG